MENAEMDLAAVARHHGLSIGIEPNRLMLFVDLVLRRLVENGGQLQEALTLAELVARNDTAMAEWDSLVASGA